MWLSQLTCAKWLPRLVKGTTMPGCCYNSHIYNCPHVNDGLGMEVCGNCISGEIETTPAWLMECCWLCIVVTRQVWNIASCIVWRTSVNPVWFNLLSSDTIKNGNGKRGLCFDCYKMHLYVSYFFCKLCMSCEWRFCLDNWQNIN